MLPMDPLSQEANDDAGEGNKGTSHLMWTPDMDRVLVDTFLKELKLGNKGDSGWKPCAYSQVRKNMRKKLGVTIVSPHIRNRLKTWRIHCVNVNKCLQHSGFRWDEVSMTLTAPDSVWAAYLKENPKADGYRMKCIPNFKDICRITGHEQVIDTLTRTGPGNVVVEKDENVVAEKDEEGSQIGGGIEDLPDEEDQLPGGKELGNIIVEKQTQKQTSSLSIPITRQGVPAKRKRESKPEEVDTVDVMVSQETNDDAGERTKGTIHLMWNADMDRVLVDTFLKELKLGNRGDNGWKPCAYAQVRRNMRQKLGFTIMNPHIRNRLKTWRIHCVTINKFLEHSGFRWDEVSMALSAPDSVWAAYLKENPKADGYRMKCIPNFRDICRITGHEQIIDLLTRTGPENVIAETDEEGSQIDGGIEDLPDEEDQLANGKELGNLIAEKQIQRLTSSSSIPTTQQGVPAKRKRDGNSEVGMVDIMGSLAEGIKRIASAMEDKKPVDLSNIVQELSKIPDFNDELVIQASEFLAFDDRLARLFFALSGDQRKAWLLKRLGH